MVSQDEHDALLLALDRQLSTQKQLEEQLESIHLAIETRPILVSTLASIRREIDAEAQTFRSEISQLKHQIEKKRDQIDKRAFSLGAVRLSADETRLSSLCEKLARTTKRVIDLEEETQSKRQCEVEITALCERVEGFCARAYGLSSRVKVMNRVVMNLVDLESEVEEFAPRMGGLSDEFELFCEEKMGFERELEVLCERCAELRGEDEKRERSLEDKIGELNGYGPELEMIEKEVCAELAQANGIREETRALQSGGLEWHRERMLELEKLGNEISRLSSEPDEGGIEVAKKLALREQLERKVTELRHSARWQQFDNPRITELMEELEGVKDERDVAADEYATGRLRLFQLREQLERKERAIKDLSSWCPLYSKVKVRPGMEEFLFLYDVVLTRNRDLASDLNTLTQEIRELEAEHTGLT
jgi:chromosome segregation ATPase